MSEEGPAVALRMWAVWVTSLADNADHAVTDEEMAAGMTGTGTYTAVCGAVVLPASLAEPPHSRCHRCVTFLRARATLRDLERRQRRHGKPTWFARLLGWRRD